MLGGSRSDRANPAPPRHDRALTAHSAYPAIPSRWEMSDRDAPFGDADYFTTTPASSFRRISILPELMRSQWQSSSTTSIPFTRSF